MTLTRQLFTSTKFVELNVKFKAHNTDLYKCPLSFFKLEFSYFFAKFTLVMKPERLIVEISNECNFECQMCFLMQKNGSRQKSFMDLNEFVKMADLLPHLESLVFSGFGEPLLNPEIYEMVRFAKSRMQVNSNISIQTNGYLLTEEKAIALIESGLSNFCISVDRLAGGFEFHSLNNAEKSFQILSKLKEQFKNLTYGAEIVLTKDNLSELLEILQGLLSFKIDFLIISHLIPSSQSLVSKVAYDTNNDASVRIFEKWSKILYEKGYSFEDWLDVAKKKAAENVDYNLETHNLYKSMYEDAESIGLTLNLKKLMEMDNEFLNTVESLLYRVKEICLQNKIKFKIPAIHPRSDRKCEFIENNCMFVSVDGDVSPCFFLWHNFECFIGNLHKKVKKVSFGNINLEKPIDIYNGDAYKKFRETVTKYEYPYCYDCNFALCDLMELENFIYDCYSNEIPCGACLWCGDLFNCVI